ncbi:MAG: Ig-like domain-containing protein [Bryobacterales bacterium]|nr:Ig-like domain-containing protein [Bryobacterales bacterium]
MKTILARALAAALPCLLLGQTAILQVRVVAGEGAVHAPGSRSTSELTVEVTDETGRPVQGAAVSFRLPEQGPGGLFSNGLSTDLVLTGADGRATVTGMRANRTPGPFQIRITVAKDQARAGIVSRQYVSEVRAVPAASAPGAVKKKGRGKWIAVALIAAGAAGGAAIGLTRNGSSPSAGAAPPALSVGPPSISIGKP